VRVGEPVVEAVDAVGQDVGGAQPLQPALSRLGAAVLPQDVGAVLGVVVECGEPAKGVPTNNAISITLTPFPVTA
jgi:hypothetical protein